jgi:hypothetical protein
VIVHCISEEQSQNVLEGIKQRLKECKLRLSEEKTKIIYCQDYRRVKRRDYPKSFDFLGHSFKPMTQKSKRGGLFLGFNCEISMKSRSRIIDSWKEMDFHRNSSLTFEKLAIKLNAKTRGIINYYGKMNLRSVEKLFLQLDFRIAKWARNKFKSLKNSYPKAYKLVKELKSKYPTLFLPLGAKTLRRFVCQEPCEGRLSSTVL